MNVATPRRYRSRSEHGSAVVELAIVSVFLITIIAGAFDFGQGWRVSLAVNESARTGARVGSAQGPARGADFYALSGVKAALESNGRLQQVNRIVIYKATSTGQVPTACKTGSTSACQVITGAAFRTSWETQAVTTATDTNGCLVIATAKNWCPTTRENRQELAEYYGIWVQVRHDYSFPLLGSGTDIERSATMRLEPKVE